MLRWLPARPPPPPRVGVPSHCTQGPCRVTHITWFCPFSPMGPVIPSTLGKSTWP